MVTEKKTRASSTFASVSWRLCGIVQLAHVRQFLCLTLDPLLLPFLAGVHQNWHRWFVSLKLEKGLSSGKPPRMKVQKLAHNVESRGQGCIDSWWGRRWGCRRGRQLGKVIDDEHGLCHFRNVGCVRESVKVAEGAVSDWSPLTTASWDHTQNFACQKVHFSRSCIPVIMEFDLSWRGFIPERKGCESQTSSTSCWLSLRLKRFTNHAVNKRRQRTSRWGTILEPMLRSTLPNLLEVIENPISKSWAELSFPEDESEAGDQKITQDVNIEQGLQGAGCEAQGARVRCRFSQVCINDWDSLKTELSAMVQFSAHPPKSFEPNDSLREISTFTLEGGVQDSLLSLYMYFCVAVPGMREPLATASWDWPHLPFWRTKWRMAHGHTQTHAVVVWLCVPCLCLACVFTFPFGKSTDWSTTGKGRLGGTHGVIQWMEFVSRLSLCCGCVCGLWWLCVCCVCVACSRCVWCVHGVCVVCGVCVWCTQGVWRVVYARWRVHGVWCAKEETSDIHRRYSTTIVFILVDMTCSFSLQNFTTVVMACFLSEVLASTPPKVRRTFLAQWPCQAQVGPKRRATRPVPDRRFCTQTLSKRTAFHESNAKHERTLPKRFQIPESIVSFLLSCSLSVESCTDLTLLHSCTFASLFPALFVACTWSLFQRTRVGSSRATK